MKEVITRRSFAGFALGALGCMPLVPKDISAIESQKASTELSDEPPQQAVDCLFCAEPSHTFVHDRRWNRSRPRSSEFQGARDRLRQGLIGEEL